MTVPVVSEKQCRRCGEVKPAAQFYRSANNADGLHSWCTACCSADAKARTARKRVEMGEEAWLEHNRRIVAASRARTDNATGRAYMKARRQALQALADRHRREFEHLLLLARRGELDGA